jgi:hypothetical protein
MDVLASAAIALTTMAFVTASAAVVTAAIASIASTDLFSPVAEIVILRTTSPSANLIKS